MTGLLETLQFLVRSLLSKHLHYRLVQCLSVLPDPKTKQFEEIQKIIFNFIWDGKIDKIRRNIMISDKHKGG